VNPYKFYHISGKLLVAGYGENGQINVWHLKEQQEESEKIRVFKESNDWPVVDVPNNRRIETHFSSELVKLCPNGPYVASVLASLNIFYHFYCDFD